MRKCQKLQLLKCFWSRLQRETITRSSSLRKSVKIINYSGPLHRFKRSLIILLFSSGGKRKEMASDTCRLRLPSGLWCEGCQSPSAWHRLSPHLTDRAEEKGKKRSRLHSVRRSGLSEERQNTRLSSSVLRDALSSDDKRRPAQRDRIIAASERPAIAFNHPKRQVDCSASPNGNYSASCEPSTVSTVSRKLSNWQPGRRWW